MITLKYLVTGLPKGATTYMCRLLTSLDIMCGHESIFKYHGIDHAKGVINGKIKPTTSYCSVVNQITTQKKDFIFIPEKLQAESSYMSAPFLNDKILNNTKIIFVVRNPWNIATSFHYAAKMWHNGTKDSEPYIKFCENNSPSVLLEKTTINKSIKFIISWFKLIEGKMPEESFIFRAEEQINLKLLDFLNKDKPINYFTNTKENSWRTGSEPPIQKKDIAEHLLIDWLNICDKYDYPLENQENRKKIFIL